MHADIRKAKYSFVCVKNEPLLPIHKHTEKNKGEDKGRYLEGKGQFVLLNCEEACY